MGDGVPCYGALEIVGLLLLLLFRIRNSLSDYSKDSYSSSSSSFYSLKKQYGMPIK